MSFPESPGSTTPPINSESEIIPENPRATYLRDLQSLFEATPGMGGIILPNPKRRGKSYLITPTLGNSNNWTGARLEPTRISDDGYELIEISTEGVRIIQPFRIPKEEKTDEELLEIAKARFEEIMAPIRKERERINSHSVMY